MIIYIFVSNIYFLLNLDYSMNCSLLNNMHSSFCYFVMFFFEALCDTLFEMFEHDQIKKCL